MLKTKIAIAVPSKIAPKSYWFRHFCYYLNHLNEQGVYDYEIFVEYDPTNNIGVLRDRLMERMLVSDCEYAIWFDDDVLFPYDVIDQMMATGKNFVTGIYWTRGTPHRPLIQQLSDPEGEVAYEFYLHEKETLFQIYSCGFGCFWMKIQKVAHLAQPRFQLPRGFGVGEDIFFCKLLENPQVYWDGFELYANAKVLCRHIMWKDGEMVLLPYDKIWKKVTDAYNKR